MNHIQILDCTLRDGGYINEWNFGLDNIKSIVNRLSLANVDIIECGFLEDGEYQRDASLFTHVDQIKDLLPPGREHISFVAMTRYGHLDINNLKPYDGESIDGIRVTFHEDEVHGAIEFCKLVQMKGYKVYVQPVGTTSYSDKYLLELIELVNILTPYAFYIVDTLGLMKKNDLLRMYYLVDNNLSEDIVIGYHSHNNLQLAFSNAQELADLRSKRSIIIDSSVYGMGRGAGNLNTELITQYLNIFNDEIYNTDYILEIVDDIISPLADKFTWGYSVPYYLAAINNCHPNYASYLMNRKTLPVKSISSILKMITKDKRELYSEPYIQQLYTQYQKHFIDDDEDISRLKKMLGGRVILVVAPGSSVKDAVEQIVAFQRENDAIAITVNYDGDRLNPNFCFFSNDKRYQKYIRSGNLHNHELILTSNIHNNIRESCSKINYSDLINAQPLVNDNAMLMLLTLLIKLGIEQVFIAGFDGFRLDSSSNYANDKMETDLDREIKDQMNSQIAEEVRQCSNKLQMTFLTDSIYKSKP